MYLTCLACIQYTSIDLLKSLNKQPLYNINNSIHPLTTYTYFDIHVINNLISMDTLRVFRCLLTAALMIYLQMTLNLIWNL